MAKFNIQNNNSLSQNYQEGLLPQRNKKNISAESKKVEAKNTLELLGVIKKENSFGAVIQKENEQEVVFLNDKIWGYSVKKIQADSVVLLKGEEEIILLIS